MKHFATLWAFVALLVLGLCLTAAPAHATSLAPTIFSLKGLIDLSIRPQRVLTTPTLPPFTASATASVSATGTGTATLTNTVTATASATVTAADTATPTQTATGVPDTATSTRTATASPTATTPPVCNLPAWHLTSLPITGTLRSIAAISDNDMWAVGDGIIHWDGSHWQVVAPALPSGVAAGDLHFSSVSAGATNSVWAVGGSAAGGVVEHWDGTAWQILTYDIPPMPTTEAVSPKSGPSPTRTATATATQVAPVTLSAVSAADPTTAFLIGNQYGYMTNHGILYRCSTTGCASIVTQGPCLSDYGIQCSFGDVSAANATNVWFTGGSFHYGGFISHWGDPLPGSGLSMQTGFSAVTVLALDNVWAIMGGTSLVHWDGSAWHYFLPGPDGFNMSGLGGRLGSDLWAFGAGVARWDGNAWVAVPGQHAAQITAISPLGPDDAWAIGTDANGAPVAEHYGVIATFGDVPAGDTFYPYIEWMACRAIIGGYACSGTECDDYGRPVFRPGNGVSRGQMLKMVVLAAGWPLLDPATATFADVPVDSTFYQAIETGVAEGIISGYACGGAGEPCDAQQRPYFRAGAPVSRGQLSKILALARNYPLPDPPTGTFADVAPGSTFYGYVEAVVAQGIVTGYPCGSTGEPCDGGSRPYFRPTVGATRAQVSKMVTRAYGGP